MLTNKFIAGIKYKIGESLNIYDPRFIQMKSIFILSYEY